MQPMTPMDTPFRIRHHHQVVYCQDEDQGFIMIFDTNMQESKEIAIVNMKDHYNVEVMDSKLIKELMTKIQEKLTKGILDNMMLAKAPLIKRRTTKL